MRQNDQRTWGISDHWTHDINRFYECKWGKCGHKEASE